MRIAWLRETESHGGEVALGFPGSAGEEEEEEAAAPAVEEVEVQGVAEVQEEEDEDLRAASSAAEEAAEEGGADTCAPSPGEGCSFSYGPVQTLRTHSDCEIINLLCVVVLCFGYHQLYFANKVHGYKL